MMNADRQSDSIAPDSAASAGIRLQRLRSALRTDGPFWRSLARFGAIHTPRFFVQHSPPFWAAPFALLLPHMRKRIRANLRRIRGPASRSRDALDTFATISHFASCLTEGFALNRPRPFPLRHTTMGREHLEAALAHPSGVILMTAHTGSWEVAGPLLKSAFGLELLVAMQREPNVVSSAIHDEARRQTGVRIVHIGTDALAVLPLLSHLRRGGAVGLQIDRTPPGVRSIEVTLFGRPAVVPAGPFLLAQATGSPLVAVFMRRRGFMDYVIHLHAPVWLSKRGPPNELAAAAQAAANALQDFLQDHPTDWFHFVD